MQTVGPVHAGERISSPDTVRSFALLGILLMNIVGFGLYAAYDNPTIAGGGTGINLSINSYTAYIRVSNNFDLAVSAYSTVTYGIARLSIALAHVGMRMLLIKGGLLLWLFQMIASPIWLRHFHFGPAEWAWRSLTYWEKQPMRKSPSAELQTAAAVS